ncbi:alpha-amylase-like isoform X2 [Brevipalpus obovatus]|uniref:alpha-amylase-like isoform X2 n=1 Tax=Brevipalpus obovatus TaxID=246614 RepID=UPI003D9E7B3B
MLTFILFLIVIIFQDCSTTPPETRSELNPYADLPVTDRQPVIVLLHEWPFDSVARECKLFLKPNGFSAIQVSVTLERTETPRRTWYERGRSLSLKIVDKNGDMTSLREMVSTCNAYGIRVIVQIESSSKNDLWTRNGPFPQSEVQFEIKSILNNLLNMGVSGFRLESTMIGSTYFTEELFNDLHLEGSLFGDSRPFVMHDTSYFFQPNQVNFGRIIVTDYADSMHDILSKQNGMHLGDIVRKLTDENLKTVSEDAVVFVDQPQIQRIDPLKGMNFRQPRLLNKATALMLAWPYGTPIIMSSYYWPLEMSGNVDRNRNMGPLAAWKALKSSSKQFQSEAEPECHPPWVCEHRYRAISRMTQFRNVVKNEPVVNFLSLSEDAISFDRGSKGFFAIVNDDSQTISKQIKTSLPNGLYCDVFSGNFQGDECTGQTFQVCDGQIHVSIEAFKLDLPMIALHVDAMVKNASPGCSSEMMMATNTENNSYDKVAPAANGLMNSDQSNIISFDNITSVQIQTHPHSKIEIKVKIEQQNDAPSASLYVLLFLFSLISLFCLIFSSAIFAIFFFRNFKLLGKNSHDIPS